MNKEVKDKGEKGKKVKFEGPQFKLKLKIKVKDAKPERKLKADKQEE